MCNVFTGCQDPSIDFIITVVFAVKEQWAPKWDLTPPPPPPFTPSTTPEHTSPSTPPSITEILFDEKANNRNTIHYTARVNDDLYLVEAICSVF